MTSFRITGLSPEPFTGLFGLSDRELAARGAKRYIVDKTPGFPDRIEMRDLEVGERAILLNYTHQSADTPYHSSHAIFVREHATRRYDRIDEVPTIMRIRLLSLRAFDGNHMMIDAELAQGDGVESAIYHLFANPKAAYIHVHNAKPGCYAGRIERAEVRSERTTLGTGWGVSI
jgi:Protein of unknown function (DUF1203)